MFFKSEGFREWIMIVVTIIGIVIGYFGTKGIEINSNDSIVTFGQSGGNNTIINNLDIPEPNVSAQIIEANTIVDDLYQSKIKVNIDSKIPLDNLYIQVEVPNLVEMEVYPEKLGMMVASNQSGNNWGYYLIQNPTDDVYFIEIKTKENVQKCGRKQ